MTINGDGRSLFAYRLSSEALSLGAEAQEQLDNTVNALFTRLDSDEVSYDTTTGNIEFPFSNGQSDLSGKATMTRIFPDWVFIRLREMEVGDEVRQAQDLVINGLHQKARQRLGI